MSALLPIIRDLIAAEGPISVAQYMEWCLQHPEHGYYRTHDPLGAAGDFITAPEISQIFGELIGLWCVESWRAMGSPAAFVLLELGPGRGTLMQDALRATARVTGFHQALHVWLLESNETLRATQRQKLAAHDPVHIPDLSGLPGLPMIVIANEFFDALPVQQFIEDSDGRRERLIEFDANAGLRFVPPGAGKIREASALAARVTEMSPLALLLMKQLAAHVARHGGAGLVIDYGYVVPPEGGTLQAVRRHERVDIFAEPGEADLTALVDFAALAAVVRQQELRVYGPAAQGAFLEAMGIGLRAMQLKHKASEAQAAAIDSGVARLTDVAAMGALFKVMAFTAKSVSAIAGFS